MALVLALLLAGLAAVSTTSSGAAQGLQAAEGQAEETPTERGRYRVPPASSEISIDAVLDEPAWRNAVVLPLEYETRPAENRPAPVKTECLLTYDRDRVYVAFRAWDPEPAAIRAHLQDRDTIWNDDLVGVKFDTFNDERRAFNFFANPLGVQLDTLEDDVGGNEDEAWDVIWDSAGRLTEYGYEVEIAIPFHQLRFPAAAGSQTWGFDAVRMYPRSVRHRLALAPVDRNVSCAVCQIAKIEGFEGVSPGRNLEIVPTLTAGATERRADFPAGDLAGGDPEAELGLTTRWGITPNLALNATLNPDFSQVEADVAQLGLNTTFALFFPERRAFFLEGADFFDTPFDAVFTRNVADPSWGVKLTGKQEKNAVGLFVAEDEVTNLLFPGSQGSRAGSFDLETLDGVVRYRRDFGDASALGVLLTGRDGDGYSNLVGGFDGLYRFRESDFVRFQYLGSSTEYPGAVAADFGQPAGRFDDHAWRLGYQHDSREWEVYARYEDVGRDFRADMGFMPQVDYKFLLGGVFYTWWGGEGDWFTQWTFGGDWDLREDQAGGLLERELEFSTEVEGPKQSELWLNVGTRDRVFGGVEFDQRWTQGWLEMQPTGDFWFGVFWRVGDTIDFANTRPADELVIEPNLRYNLGRHFRLQLNHTYQGLDVEGGDLFDANLTQLRLIYQLNVRSFARAILQYRDVTRDPRLFDDEVPAESRRLFTQLLFSYKLNPQTVLFVGYSDTRDGDETIDLTQRNRSLFLKIGFAWVL